MTNDDELPVQRVAVTVFAEVRAFDAADAADVAEIAIRQACNSDGRSALPSQIEYRFRDRDPVRVTVAEVKETGTALLNGLLSARPTSRGFERR